MTNRKPLDTPWFLHKFLDSLFYQKFKWYPRSTGVFCTSSKKYANMFGFPYIFFPLNGFKYIYNPTVEDIYEVLESEIDINKFNSEKIWIKCRF